jgi:hypothetical protein
MMVFLGVVVGGLIIAMYLPIFELAGNIKRRLGSLVHDLKRRITYLMLVRVVSITLVLGLTVAFNLAEPSELAAPRNVLLFVIVGAPTP